MDNTEMGDIRLKLGDIIQIESLTNPDLHQNTFIIDYIDDSQIAMINVANVTKTLLTINQDGGLSDESITSILLMDRSDEEGYARQNGLLPHVWLDVYIGGDTPTVITGEITNLEDDMIEIVTFPERMTIYINFEYKGIPQYIPFNKFVVRSKPINAPKDSLTPIVETPILEEDVPLGEISSVEVMDSGDMIINVPENAIPDDNIRDVLRAIYLDANEIVFGDELEDIVQLVELPESQKKYSIEVQANDLMDQLLSTIPNNKRTTQVMNNIHVIIERFKQLRNKYSEFDTNMNVTGFTKNDILHKPLINKIHNLSTKLQWIVPVVSQKRKIYTDIDEDEMHDDIIQTSIGNELFAQMELIKQYTQGSQHGEKYSEMYANMDKYNTPFIPSDKDGAIVKREVLTDIDAIVNNLGKFNSSVSHSISKSENNPNKAFSYIEQRKFVIQRYNLGLMKKDTVLMKSGKVVYIRNNMTPNDKMTLTSLLILPEPVMQFSRINLPSTNIMTRTNLHENYLSLFRLLKQKTTITSHIVDDLDNEIKYDDESDNDDDDDNDYYGENNQKDDTVRFMKTIKEYVLDEKFENEPDKFEKFLRTIIPKTRVIFRLLRKYIKNKMSFVEIVKELEPFLIYSDDIMFNQFKEIRYYIKNKMVEYIKHNEERAEKFRNISIIKDSNRPLNFIENIFLNDDKMGDLFESAYSSKDERVPTSELLFRLIKRDGCTLFSDVISVLSIKELVNPENIVNEFEPSKIDDIEYVKSKDCTRRYLSKRYSTMKALQSDNNNEDVFYDLDLDDTPYKLLDTYGKERKHMLPEIFLEFMTETLMQKHSVRSDYAEELAKTLIEGKKRVRDGEFAVLTIQPTLPPSVDKTKLTEQDIKDLEIEAKARQKVGYYHRVKNHWVHDQTIDDEVFVDTNTLFCNIQSECVKNQSNNICESTQTAKKRMNELTKARMVKEFENRVNMSIDQLIQKGKTELDRDYKRVIRENSLREIAENRYSIYAYELGKTSITIDVIISPYALLRDLILGQNDFVKKQSDIIKLVDTYSREPMAELKEDSFWLYCKDTNTKLLPQSLYHLAIAFVTNLNYSEKLDEIIASHGTISDDGDSIVDKHSGYVLRKIDFTTEEGFIDGFKIVTNDVIEQDLRERLADIFAPKPKPIFENESNEIIYNIIDSICNNMGIPTDSVQEFVMRTVLETMERNVQSSEKYEEISDMIFKKKNARPIPYEIYRNRFMFWIVASCILVAIQTAIPSFRVKKTYPGCVRSFSGYPLDGGIEDLTGIKYIACVMKKMESRNVPWNSIEKLDANIYVIRIKDTIEKFIISSQNDLYVAKQKYILEHPNEVIPEEHSVDKWRTFLPPIVKYKMSPINSISKDFERDFYDVMTKGNQQQHASLNIIKSKCSQMGFGIIETINQIVRTKDPILKTASKDPFLENACCNETNISRPMDYFIDNDAIIQKYIDNAAHLGELMSIAKELARPTTLYHKEFTGVIRPVVTATITDEHIYLSFIHYCNFTNDIPIPDEYITVSATKPIGFPKKAPLIDQIEFLKKNGKRYTINDLQSLMTLVRNTHSIQLPEDKLFSQISVIYDLLEAYDSRDSIVIPAVFRDNLRLVLNSYNPKVMVVNERKELTKFKNYLAYANEKMYYDIVQFFDQYGNLSDTDYNRLQNFLLSFTTTNLKDADALHTVTTFVKNSVYMMSNVFPEIILNGNIFDSIPTHWDLSPNHISNLSKKIDSYWSSIQEFHGDTVISKILQNIQINASDIFILLREIPVLSPITKDGNTYYSLFDNETINMIYMYLWYSTLYEYIAAASNPDFLRTDIEEKKSLRRQKIIDSSDASAQIIGMDPDESDLQEIDIRIGNSEELKVRVAKLLLTFLEIEQGNKKYILSYDEIAKKIRKEKNIEKQNIIQYLGNMDKEERQIEDQFKRYKMGRWNVGLQKGLVEYDKKTYDRETTDIVGDMDIEAIEEMENMEADEAEDNEAMDISNLDEDYRDGDYYGEDDAE